LLGGRRFDGRRLDNLHHRFGIRDGFDGSHFFGNLHFFGNRHRLDGLHRLGLHWHWHRRCCDVLGPSVSVPPAQLSRVVRIRVPAGSDARGTATSCGCI
jgi:hypothetical protein